MIYSRFRSNMIYLPRKYDIRFAYCYVKKRTADGRPYSADGNDYYCLRLFFQTGSSVMREEAPAEQRFFPSFSRLVIVPVDHGGQRNTAGRIRVCPADAFGRTVLRPSVRKQPEQCSTGVFLFCRSA